MNEWHFLRRLVRSPPVSTLPSAGRQDLKRIYACVMHLDIHDEKVWIQRNMTEVDIAATLVEMGIPKEDIVIGLQPVYKRPYTSY